MSCRRISRFWEIIDRETRAGDHGDVDGALGSSRGRMEGGEVVEVEVKESRGELRAA